MAISQEIGSETAGAQSAGVVDLLIGVAGPVSGDDLRQLALDATTSSGLRVAIASPAASVAEAAETVGDPQAALQFVTYPLAASAVPILPWLAAPAAYREIARLAEKVGARACVIVSPDLGAMNAATIAALAGPLLDGTALLSIPLYPTGKLEGLLNSGILYPFMRALYGRQIRHPFTTDFGLAGTMISMFAADAPRGQGRSILCPVLDGTLADARMAQAYVSVSHVAHSDGIDLSTVLGVLAGCLFEDAEKNAAVWQRTRGSQAIPTFGRPATAARESEPVDLRPLLESFNLGLRNLQEIWGRVLPPVTLLDLKRLSRLPAEEFRMPDSLWAKIVYDFALAHRLRSISRTHLLGALTPLYLGWVASYAAEVQAGGAVAAEERIERLAAAYEESKPYFVSRWRWPDRFNP